MSVAVLVLDSEYRPLRVESWQKAICDFFTGKVEILEHSRDRTIQGVNRTYPMPAVVRVLRRFKRERLRIKFSRLNVYARDKFMCQYCGIRFMSEDLTFDHVLPQSHGGKTCWENIVACCGVRGNNCNARKSNRTPEQAGMRLLSKPKKPLYLPAVTVKMDLRNVPEEWKGYWTDVLEQD
jgi:5-methylcytosine-specific restriction endonuclease McrA